EDDLLLYLAGESTVEQGHCLVRCPGEKGAAASDSMQFLADAEIGSIANDSRCASVTLVLEVDQCGTGFWLDPGKTGNCVFASGRYEERNGSGQHIDNRERGIFTKAMITCLRKSGLRITNRQLFVDVLSEYRQLTQLLYSNSGVGDEINPDLYCHEDSYQHFFLRGRNYMVQLQDALRSAGYLDKGSTGKWDLETSAALKTFCEEAGVQGLLTKQQYISLLEELSRQQATLAPPVFVVVFADEQNSLLLDARKESGILDAVRLIQRKAVVSLMWQPSRKAISEFFMDPVNRNRIQLLYVAGLYGNQDPAAGDGPVTLADLAAFLPFQQNLKLFFSNTRLSGDLADYATRIGLPLAIANMDEVYYADAAEHGMRVMNGIASSAAPVEWLETGGGNFKTFSATKSIDLSRPIWDWQAMPEMQKKDSSSRRIVSLLVGIDKYRNVSPLNGCVNGARKMGGMLSLLNQHEKFDVAGVTELADEEATRENMLQRFNQLFEAANPGDACLLYFSGHAANQSFTENRLMPVDYNPSIAGTDITQDLFIQNLERANREKTCQVILVIDSHSGYYRWVGEDDIMIGAVRHSIQTEQAFPGHETSSAFIIALTDIIKSCNGLITYRHLQAWLRFKITEEFNLPGELPVVMASASNYDQYFLTRVRRTIDDLPLVAYNNNLSRWQLIEEDFKKV
ncbi:MAG: caspase family protein, partial [Chitinophagaceae bacterium]